MRDIVNALLVERGRVLLARRSPRRKAYPGLWSFPGGHMEKGEDFEAALERELREEIGIDPIEHRLIGRIADPNAAADDPATYHMYVVTEWRGDPRLLDHEHTELRWFEPVEAIALPDLALVEYRPLLQELSQANPFHRR